MTGVLHAGQRCRRFARIGIRFAQGGLHRQYFHGTDADSAEKRNADASAGTYRVIGLDRTCSVGAKDEGDLHSRFVHPTA